MKPLGCFTGRLQPVHRQHLELFTRAQLECEQLVIGLTNPDPGARHQEATSPHRHTAAANPFTYFERVQLLKVVLTAAEMAERTTIVPFDLTRSTCWSHYVPLAAQQYVRAYSDWERQKAQWLERAGYAVTLIDGDPAIKLSSSDIRASMRAGDGRWRTLVLPATVPLLDAMLRQTPIGERA